MKGRASFGAPALGISYEETLMGAFYSPSEPHRQRPIVLRLTARAPSLAELVRSRTVGVDGHLLASGLASEAEARGTIRLTREGLSAIVAYRVLFEDDGGERRVLAVTKRFDLRAPYPSLTVLAGTIADERGAAKATCLLRFDARSDLVTHLRSFRVSLR